MLPTYSNAAGTRGEVLLARGNFEQARTLLWQAVRGTYGAESAAANLSALVRLAALESNQPEFDRLQQLARLLDPRCRLLDTMDDYLVQARQRGHSLRPLSPDAIPG